MLIKQEISLEPYIVTEDDEVGATETSLIVKITQAIKKFKIYNSARRILFNNKLIINI
jgi:hypothetical protein